MQRDFDNILQSCENKNIAVEIGGIRNLSEQYRIGDGHSTIFLVKYFKYVYSVDIDPNVASLTQCATNNPPNLICVTADGIDFLKSFDKQIDFLYLDGWDCIAGTDYKEKHIEAFQTAEDKLSPSSLVLIDDMENENEGKGALIIPYAIKKGWQCKKIGKQVLLKKN